jgi:hypothetical protein
MDAAASAPKISDTRFADHSNPLFEECGPYDMLWGVEIDHCNDQLKMAAIVPMPPDEQERLQTAKERLQTQQRRLRRYRSGEPVWGVPKVLLKNVNMIRKKKQADLRWLRRARMIYRNNAVADLREHRRKLNDLIENWRKGGVDQRDLRFARAVD